MALSAAEQEVVSERVIKMRDDLVEQFFVAFGNAGAKFDAEGIQREIISELTRERRALALKMLGFDDRCGKLEVDHCNGRTSVASEFIKSQVGPAVKRWADECLRPMLEERGRAKLHDAAVMKAIMKDFDHRFQYAARQQMEHLAAEAGEEFATALANQIKAGMRLSTEN